MWWVIFGNGLSTSIGEKVTIETLRLESLKKERQRVLRLKTNNIP